MTVFRILLVEDNPDHAMLVSGSLEGGDLPLEIVHAEGGAQALDHMEAVRAGRAAAPNLVLLDLNMPGIDGFDVLDALKSDPEFHLIPTVVLSTSTAAVDIRRALGAHANSFAVKSPDFDEMDRDVRSLRQYWSATHKSADPKVA